MGNKRGKLGRELVRTRQYHNFKFKDELPENNQRIGYILYIYMKREREQGRSEYIEQVG